MRKKTLGVTICLLLAMCLLSFFAACKMSDSDESETNKPSSEKETHTLTYVDKVEPTCTTSGTKAYYSCSHCNKLFKDSEGKNGVYLNELKIPPLGHTLKFVEKDEGSCLEKKNGYKEHYSCVRCNEKYAACDGYEDGSLELKTTNGETVTVKAAGDLALPYSHKFGDSGKCEVCGEERGYATENLRYTLSQDGSYYILSGIGDCKDEVIFIGSYNGKPVKEIGENAFYGEKSIKAVVFLPQSEAVKIGDGAFENCVNLKSVNVMTKIAKGNVVSLSEIGENAFKGVSSELHVVFGGAKSDWLLIKGCNFITIDKVTFKTEETPIIPIG